MNSFDGKNKKRKELPISPIKKNLFLPGNVIICGYGCSTPVLKDPKLGWIEYVGNRQHTPRRCKQVINEKKEKDKQYSYKKPRESIVSDLEDRLHELKSGMNDEERIFHLLQYRTTLDDAVSMKELALAMFPDEVITDKDTEQREPKHEAVEKVTRALSKIRKNPKNKNVVSFAKKMSNGVMMYFNEQTRDDLIDAKRRMEANIEGRKTTMKNAEEIIDSGQVARQRNAKEFEKEIEKNIQIRNIKKKKKKQGDDNNN